MKNLLQKAHWEILLLFLLIRGRFSELINYWHYLGVDQATLGMKYIDVVKHMEEGKGVAFILSFKAVIQMLIPLNPWEFKVPFVIPIIFNRSSWEKLLKYQSDSSCVIISSILMTSVFYYAVILQGELWRWSLLGIKGLYSKE